LLLVAGRSPRQFVVRFQALAASDVAPAAPGSAIKDRKGSLAVLITFKIDIPQFSR
jgi:hypothetical protein